MKQINRKPQDLTGYRFGKLTVKYFVGRINGSSIWYCECDCKGTIGKGYKEVNRKYLIDGSTQSCGCKVNEHLDDVRNNKKYSPKKEEYTKPFYKDLINNWRTLIDRCHNPNYKGYQYYGEKGIYVCDEWRNNFWSFYNWSIENGYQKGYTLDRLGNNYNPDSCEWVDKSTNCGSTTNGTQITIRKKTQTAAAWAKEPECEVTASTILNRYKKGIKGTKLLKKRQEFKDKKIEIDGQIGTLEEWSKYAEISLSAIKQRYRRGIRGKDLIKPSLKRNKQNNENATYKNAS